MNEDAQNLKSLIEPDDANATLKLECHIEHYKIQKKIIASLALTTLSIPQEEEKGKKKRTEMKMFSNYWLLSGATNCLNCTLSMFVTCILSEVLICVMTLLVIFEPIGKNYYFAISSVALDLF